tara:strand:+ start:413 stop:583 length:171 start_codon:yes stop_codon:yes gene_type:complete
MCGRNIHDKDEKKQKQQKQTVLWTVYHTVLAVELAIIILIEGIELFDYCSYWWGYN